MEAKFRSVLADVLGIKDIGVAAVCHRRWQGLLGCAAARAFSCSLLDVASPGGDGATPSMNAVLGEARYA